MLRRKKETRKATPPKRSRRKVAKPAGPSRMARWWGDMEPDRKRRLRKTALWAVACLAVLIGGAVVLREMEHRVLRDQAIHPAKLRLDLSDRPAWMPLALQRRIVSALVPPRQDAYDRALPEKVYQRAQRNPWIRTVTSVRRRHSDDLDVATLEIQAVFRKPVAKIRVGGGFVYLDAEGVVLPSDDVPRWVAAVRTGDGATRQVCFVQRDEVPPGVTVRPVHYFHIDGAAESTLLVGDTWPGEDVAAGLRLIALLADKPYANQISMVDVRNHEGRISREEPHLRLFAQKDQNTATDIRFGRFPRPGGDFVISPERKMSYLDEYVKTHDGRLAGGNAYLDLRFDQLHVSVY
jgi:hypothetical protein